MRKLIFSLIGISVVMLAVIPFNQAEEVSFPVSATIPLATGVTISATQINALTDEWGQKVTDLNFDPMDYKTFEVGDNVYNAWLPDHYFAIDVGVTGGTGSTDINVKYSESSTPEGQIKGLGYKSTATFVKVTTEEETTLDTALLFQLIGAGKDISATQLSGGFFRLYVGIFDGSDANLTDDGGEPFTNSDRPGNYTGTLTITATVS